MSKPTSRKRAAYVIDETEAVLSKTGICLGGDTVTLGPRRLTDPSLGVRPSFETGGNAAEQSAPRGKRGPQ